MRACQQRWRNRASALGAESNKTPQKAADAIIDALACPDLNQRLDMLRKAMFVAKEDRLSKNLEKFPAAQEAEPELQRLLTARRQHDAWQHQQRMARLARCLIAQFAAVKQQHGWVDMNDVERTALVMLADPILSGWVQERLDARIRHLLVDEFQDTNPLQWQALHAWLAGYAGSGGGSGRAQRVHRGRPQAEHLPLSPCRAAGVHRRAGLCARRAGRRPAQLRPHAPQRAGRDCRRQRRHGRRPRRSTRPQASATTPPNRNTPASCCACPPLPMRMSDGQGASRDPLAWRDSLTEPRHEAEETQRMRECAQAAAWVAAQIASGTPPKEVLVLARKRDRLASHARRPARPAPALRAARKGRPVRRTRGAGHGGAARCAGLAHARPVAGPCAQVAAVRPGRRCPGGPGRAAPPARACGLQLV
jgi:ATP-dependent helicase/nuclease subunit A